MHAASPDASGGDLDPDPPAPDDSRGTAGSVRSSGNHCLDLWNSDPSDYPALTVQDRNRPVVGILQRPAKRSRREKVAAWEDLAGIEELTLTAVAIRPDDEEETR